MATLEDKILGEKLHNYCSSSEGEDSDDEKKVGEAPPAPEVAINKWEGTSSNTGPKGVITDWQRYKRHEQEKRVESEKQKVELAKKLTMTVQSSLDEERERALREDPELAELMDDEFLVSYQKKRMQELIQQTNHSIKFGNLIYLTNGQEFLDAIDKEHKSVTVIIHIYEEKVDACRTMNECLKLLAKLYKNSKFCCIKGSCAGISAQFKSDGVPALLVYKCGNLVGNFIRVSDELGADFAAEDVQGYLVEHGHLEDKSCTPELIKSSLPESDSD